MFLFISLCDKRPIGNYVVSLSVYYFFVCFLLVSFIMTWNFIVLSVYMYVHGTGDLCLGFLTVQTPLTHKRFLKISSDVEVINIILYNFFE